MAPREKLLEKMLLVLDQCESVITSAGVSEKVIHAAAADRTLSVELLRTLEDQRLSEAPKKCTELWQRTFPDAQPLGMDLRGIDLSTRWLVGECIAFHGANLEGANLNDTKWFFADIRNVNLARASMRDAHFYFSTFKGCCFHEADLSGADIQLIDKPSKEPLDFSGANCAGAQFTVFQDSRLNLSGARMEGCRVTAGSMAYTSAKDQVGWKRARDSFVASLSPEQRRVVKVEGKACFIATAACSTDQAPDVVSLRQFRDLILSQSSIGRLATRVYEHLSPPLAHLIARSELLKRGTRRLLIGPAASLARRQMERAIPKQTPPSALRQHHTRTAPETKRST